MLTWCPFLTPATIKLGQTRLKSRTQLNLTAACGRKKLIRIVVASPRSKMLFSNSSNVKRRSASLDSNACLVTKRAWFPHLSCPHSQALKLKGILWLYYDYCHSLCDPGRFFCHLRFQDGATPLIFSLFLVCVKRCESVRMRGSGLGEKLDFPAALFVRRFNSLQKLSMTWIRLKSDGTDNRAFVEFFAKKAIENGQKGGVGE